MSVTGNRRPLRSREAGWASKTLGLLLRTPVTADGISVLGIVFAALGAVALLNAAEYPFLFLVGAAGIQLRLLANLMDGLVAVEGGRGGPYGPLMNEVPDRLEDTMLLAAFGVAVGLTDMGWGAAVLAVAAAYVRTLGGSLGLPQDFCGPMAKPHRMATLTVGCFLGFGEAYYSGGVLGARAMLWAIVIGTAITILRRLWRQGRRLRALGR